MIIKTSKNKSTLEFTWKTQSGKNHRQWWPKNLL